MSGLGETRVGGAAVPEIDVDLWADEILADPYPVYARLRSLGPVLFSSRNPTDHLSFGRVVHRCVGANLAQEEIRAVFDHLADHVVGFEVVERRWRRNNSLHGLERPIVRVR